VNDRRLHVKGLDVAFMLALVVLGVGVVVAAYERSLHVFVFAVVMALVSMMWVAL
jgi:hypothetical protein